MGRLSRVEQRGRNRARVLAAAREEFAERGYRDAKVDVIAERAELTRGAVYSNFPGKRALYLAVLAEYVAEPPPGTAPGRNPAEAVGALARAWVGRFPLSQDDRYDRLGRDLLAEIISDERTRQAFAQLMGLNALLLASSLEGLGGGRRMVRVAEAVLTTLYGAAQLAAAAPGFGEPFVVVRACERLTTLESEDPLPPSLFPEARTVDEPWSPPPVTDLVTGEPADLTGDGAVVVLGLERAAAAEDAVRAVDPGTPVTVALVTADPAELAPLARLVVTDLVVCLRQAVPRTAWPRLRVVCDEEAAVAAAVGVEAVADRTETAVRVAGGRLVARAVGLGAGHTLASAAVRDRHR